MAGIFKAFMQGKELSRSQRRQDADDEWTQDERQFQRGRQETGDERAAEVHSWDVEDRPEVALQLGLRGDALDQNVKLGRLHLDRAPTVFDQQDAQHELSMQQGRLGMNATRQSMAHQGAAEGRAQQQHSNRMMLDKLRMDEATLQAEHNKFAHQIAGPVRRFMMTGETKGLGEAWRKAMGSDSQGELVKVGDDHYALMDPATGQQQDLGSRENVVNVMSSFMQRPDAYLALRHEQKFGGGQGAKQPAAVQEAEYVARLLPAMAGETDQQRRLRAYQMTQYKNMGRPEEVRAKIATEMVQGMSLNTPSGRVDPDELRQRVDMIMQTIYSDPAGRGPGMGAAMQQGPGDDTALLAPPPEIPREAIGMLMDNPQLADKFDEEFGPGAAMRILGHSYEHGVAR